MCVCSLVQESVWFNYCQCPALFSYSCQLANGQTIKSWINGVSSLAVGKSLKIELQSGSSLVGKEERLGVGNGTVMSGRREASC